MDERTFADLTALHFNNKKNDFEMKKKWYRIGKKLINKEKIPLCAETKVGARRTYHLYKVNKGDWKGPSTRQLSKMGRLKFNQLLQERENKVNGVTLTFEGESLSGLNPQNHVTGDVAVSWINGTQ